MEIRYIFSYPLAMDQGGGALAMQKIVQKISILHNIKLLDFLEKKIDFDVLFVFGSTFINPDILEFYKEKKIKIILFPIYDRLKPVWLLKSFKLATRFPVLNIYSIRKRILNASDIIIVHNHSEYRDLYEIHNADKNKMKVLHLGINDEIVELSKTISKNLFYNEYKFSDFVFCPSASISNRKNQIQLIKALKDKQIKLVLNGAHNIKDNLEAEFRDLTQGDSNILCLPNLSLETLVSCYKNARVSVSVSQAETAGLVNLEAAYLGCNLVVSDLEALHEYLNGWAIYVNQNNLESILSAIAKALIKDYDPAIQKYILENYSWDNYITNLLKFM